MFIYDNFMFIRMKWMVSKQKFRSNRQLRMFDLNASILCCQGTQDKRCGTGHIPLPFVVIVEAAAVSRIQLCRRLIWPSSDQIRSVAPQFKLAPANLPSFRVLAKFLVIIIIIIIITEWGVYNWEKSYPFLRGDRSLLRRRWLVYERGGIALQRESLGALCRFILSDGSFIVRAFAVVLCCVCVWHEGRRFLVSARLLRILWIFMPPSDKKMQWPSHLYPFPFVENDEKI